MDEELIAEFHRLWDCFPGMARLIDRNHSILAANEEAIRQGFIPGLRCCDVVTKNNHRGCLLGKMLKTGLPQADKTSPSKIRGWVPVTGRPDVFVHFTLYLPSEEKTNEV